ncbi:ABC transporter permease subunit [Streptomyces sp. 5.8]
MRQAGFVEVTRSMESGGRRIVRRHVLPHARGPVTSLAALEFGDVILAVSGLSFLGYGAELPTAEWTLLVADGRDYVTTSWWLSTLLGLTTATTVLRSITWPGPSMESGAELDDGIVLDKEDASDPVLQ